MKSLKAKYVLSEWTKDDEKLLASVERNQPDKINNLVVKKKVDPTKIEPKKGFSSLHLAVAKGYASAVDIFLSQGLGAKIDTKDFGGYTATHHAAKNGDFPVLQKLLQQKPNLSVFDRQMKSALHHACEGGNLGCVQLLLAEKISVHYKDREGKTALCHAAEKGQASMCRLLIENGSDVNEVDIEGRTPLILAAMENHSTVCTYLLLKGASINAVDTSGNTAIKYAEKKHYIEVLKILRQTHAIPEMDKTSSRKSLEKEILDHPYEPIGVELGRNEGFPLHEETLKVVSSIAEHKKGAAPPPPVTPPPRPQRLPPFSGKSTSLMELDGGQESTIGEKLGFKSDILATKIDSSDLVDGKKKAGRYSLGTDRTVQDDEKEGHGDLEIGNLNLGSFREMLDDAFRKNNLLEEKEWDDSKVMDEVKSVDLSEELEEPTTLERYRNRDINLPINNTLLFKDSSIEARKGSYTPMSPASDASTSISAIAELNQRDDDEISLPRFDLIEDPQIARFMKQLPVKSSQSPVKSKAPEVHYISSDYPVMEKDVLAKETEVLKGNVESGPTYTDILNNTPESKLLGEHARILEELNKALEKRNEMELERIELQERLNFTSRSQKLVMQELLEMKKMIDEMIESLDERNFESADVSKFKEDLESIRSQLDSLLKMELLDEIDNVHLYSHSPNSDAENQEMASKIKKLEREKYDLASKLKEILRENSQLHCQVGDIEHLIEEANGLKIENEGLISDCRELMENPGKDSTEVEDLMRLFKETIEENNILKIENQELLNKLSSLNAADGVDELKKENVRLIFERMQLEEAAERQATAFLEMAEKLQASEKVLKMELLREEDDRTLALSQENYEVDYKQMYEELKNESMEVLDELRAKEALVNQYNSIVYEYEELQKENALLRNSLEKKKIEVKQLNEQVQNLGERLKEVFSEYNEAIEAMQNENQEEYNKLKAENQDLHLAIQELNQFLDEKDKIIANNMTNRNSKKNNLQNMESQTEQEVNDPDESKTSSLDRKKNRSPIYEDLKNVMLESKSLIKENNKLKKQLSEIDDDKSKPDNDAKLKDENQTLKEANEKLHFEITSLKRTISEQGAYLAHLTPNSSDLEKNVLPSEITKEIVAHVKQEAPENRGQRAEIDKLSSEIIILKSQVECLEKMKEETARQNEENANAQSAKVQSLEKLYSDIGKKFAEKEEKVLELNDTLKEQQKELISAKRLEGECDKLIKDFLNISDFVSQNDINNSDRKVYLVEMRQWLSKMKNQSAEQKHLKSDNENLFKEAKQLKEEVEKLHTTNKNLSKEKEGHMNETESKLEAIQERLTRESEEVEKLKSSLTDLNNEEGMLRDQLEMLKVQLRQKDEEFEFRETKLSEELQARETEKMELINKLEKQSNQLSKEQELLNKIENLTAQASHLQEQLNDKNEEINLLKHVMNVEIEKLKHDLAAEMKVTDGKEKEYQLLQGKCNELLAEKEDIEKVHCTEIAELKSKLNKSDQNVNDLCKSQNAYCQLAEQFAKMEKGMEKLELDLKNMTSENNKAVEKIADLKKYCTELEKLNAQLNDKSVSAKEGYKIISELKEANVGLKERMASLELEKHKLIFEKEQTQHLLDMEKLKNQSVTEEQEILFKYPHNGFTSSPRIERHLSPSYGHGLISVSPVSKHQCFEDFNSSVHNDRISSPDNLDISSRLAEENKILRKTLDKIEFGFCQPMRLKSEATQTLADFKNKINDETDNSISVPLAMVTENRRLFLEIANLHSSLRRRSSFIVQSNGWSSRHSSLEQQRQDFERVEHAFLDEIASKSLEHLSVLIAFEEEVDQMWKHKAVKHNGILNGSLQHQESSLVTRLKMHSTSLRQLKDLLQSVIDNEKFYDVALEELASHYPLLTGVNTIIQPGPSPSSSVHQLSNNEESSKLLMQLQHQLMENERKYKEIIQKYRRHLICAVQGQMDPEVKESLLNFIESKKMETRK